jgi:uncharacterized protein (DUF4415 family)
MLKLQQSIQLEVKHLESSQFGAQGATKEPPYTVSQMKEMALHDETDWERVAKLTDADIELAMGEDDDWKYDISPDFSKVVFVPSQSKKPISIRLSPDVLAFFKSYGKGYQTHINEVLRAYMSAKLAPNIAQ